MEKPFSEGYFRSEFFDFQTCLTMGKSIPYIIQFFPDSHKELIPEFL